MSFATGFQSSTNEPLSPDNGVQNAKHNRGCVIPRELFPDKFTRTKRANPQRGVIYRLSECARESTGISRGDHETAAICIDNLPSTWDVRNDDRTPTRQVFDDLQRRDA